MPTQPTVKYFLAATAPTGDSPRMTITTNAADREGDRVVPEGGQFANFLKNPVLCWVHDYKHIPIGRVTELQVQPGKGIEATWAWLENDDFAARVKNAYGQGCINASSIGFIPLESTPNGTGRDITSWEMLELTLCPIPMNPEAVRAMKSLGFLGTTTVDGRIALRAQASTLKASALEKSYEFTCGLNAMGCVESLLSMESAEPDQATTLSQAAQLILTYLSQEFAECYGANGAAPKGKDDGAVEQDAQLDAPLLPMDNESTYPFVSATGITDETITLSLSDDDDVVLELSDTPRLTLELKDAEDVMDVDPDALQAALRDVIGSTLREHVSVAMQTAVDRARGRVVV